MCRHWQCATLCCLYEECRGRGFCVGIFLFWVTSSSLGSGGGPGRLDGPEMFEFLCVCDAVCAWS